MCYVFLWQTDCLIPSTDCYSLEVDYLYVYIWVRFHLLLVKMVVIFSYVAFDWGS